MRILTPVEAPTNYLDKDDQLVGISVDLVNELRKVLNINNEIEVATLA